MMKICLSLSAHKPISLFIFFYIKIWMDFPSSFAFRRVKMYSHICIIKEMFDREKI